MTPGLSLVAVFAAVTAGLILSERVGGGSAGGALIGWGSVIGGVALAELALRRDGASLRDFGLRRPRSWRRTIAWGVAAAVGITVAATLMLPWLMRLVEAAPDVSRFEALQGNPVALAAGIAAAWTAAAFGEEALVRGYLMGQLARWLGHTTPAWIMAAIVSSSIFGALHFYQGAGGVAITAIVGFMLALVYLACGRNLWVPIVAHGLIDTVSLVSIFLAAR